jgi:hypothetical protein
MFFTSPTGHGRALLETCCPHTEFPILLVCEMFDLSRLWNNITDHHSYHREHTQVGKDKFKDIDIRIRVRGGGNTSQVYAIRQAIAKGIVAYYRESMA